MRATDNEDGVARPVGTIDEGEPASWGPTGPDGGPTPEAVNLLAPVPVPEFTPRNSPCLRNCRHFLRAWSHFDVGNTAGCFAPGQEPRVQHVACMVQPGVHLELTADSPVLDCNRWDPLPDREIRKLARRRKKYLAKHPLGDDNDDLDLEDDDDEPADDLD